MSLSVKEILNIGKRQLEDSHIADADIDSKALYCFLMNISSAQLILEYQKILQDSLCDEYFRLLDRRSRGIPLQHITGSQEFMGLNFQVDEHVLIPRQDTETMVEDAMEIIEKNTLRGESLEIKKKKEFDILDLCCGSGAIGLSLAKLCHNVKVTCTDISEKAIEMAKKNAAHIGVNKVTFEEGNLFTPLRGRFKNKKFDMIISNPPYIKSSVIPTLQREVRDHEPLMALDGGSDGLDFYRGIIKEAPDYLKKEGILILEIGHDQKKDVCGLLEEKQKFAQIIPLKDLAGKDRIIVATLAGKI